MLHKPLLLMILLSCVLAVSAQTAPPSYSGPAPTPTPAPQSNENRYTVVGSPVEGAKNIAGGVLNGKAISLPQPSYPAEARAARAHGPVEVQVLIDEEGRVMSAKATKGDPLLHQVASDAAMKALFQPTRLSGHPVKVSGVITYNFVFDTQMKDVAVNWGMFLTLLRSPEAKSILSRSLVSVVKFLASTVPSEMSEDKAMLEELAAATEAERPAIVDRIIETFTRRASKEVLWRFEVGLAMGRLRIEFESALRKREENPQVLPDLAGMYRELREVKKLSDSAPRDVPESLKKAVAEVAAFAEDPELGTVMQKLAYAAEKVN